MIYAHLRPDALREEALKTVSDADLQARLEALEAENASLRRSFEK